MSETSTVWFNHHLSSSWQTFRQICQIRSSAEFRLLCSNLKASTDFSSYCDLFVTEPSGISNDDYVTFCLETAEKFDVRVFFPWRRLSVILEAENRFRQLGTQLFVPAPLLLLPLFDNKAAQFAFVKPNDVDLPDYRIARNATEFTNAVMELQQRHAVVCFKPTCGMFGHGFFLISTETNGDLLAGIPDSFLRTLPQAITELRQKKVFPELMVMQYLKGPERSIDCLALDGEFLRGIIRKKSPGQETRQQIERNDTALSIVRRLTQRFQLNGLFNIQLREHDGRLHLLEINPRMSGGLPATFATDCVLPYWAIRLALGTVDQDDIPYPQTDLWIDTTTTALTENEKESP